MSRDKELYNDSFGAGDKDLLYEVLQDDSAFGDTSKNFLEFMGNESLPSEQFNENHHRNNRFSSLASSILGIPSPNNASQLTNLRLFNGNIFHRNGDSGNGNSSNSLSKRHNIHLQQPNNNLLPVHTSLITAPPSSDVTAPNGPLQLFGDDPFVDASDNLSRGHDFIFNRRKNIPFPFHTSPFVGIPSWNVGLQNLQPQLFRSNNVLTNIDCGNGAVLNNLSEGYNFPCKQPSNNFEPLNRSPMIGGTSLYVAHQNNDLQLLADTPHSNIDSGKRYYGGNRCRGIQEPVTGVGTSSATFSASLIAKESNRSRQNNLKVNPIIISHPRIEQFIPNGSTAQLAEKEDLPLQGLRELPDMVKKLDKNDGNVEDFFKNMHEYANSAANEHGKKLLEQAEADPKREKEKEIRNIHAKKSNKKRPARELFLRGTVCVLVDDRKRLKQQNEALRKLIEQLASRSNPTGLSVEPPPNDSKGGNSGGDSSGREPGPGKPSSRNTQAEGFNGMTFSNSQSSTDGSASDDLSATMASRMSLEKLLTSSPDGNCVSNSRDNVQSSVDNVYQDFLLEEHSDDDECDDSGESSNEGSDDSTEMNYRKGDHCSERENNERKACSTRNDDGPTSYTEKNDNWCGHCTEEADGALLEGMRMNERETADGSNHSSQMNNGECDDCTIKKGNARVGCIEMNGTGQGESKNNTNKPHLNSTPPLKPRLAIPPTRRLPILRSAVDIPPIQLPPSIFHVRNQLELFAYPLSDSE